MEDLNTINDVILRRRNCHRQQGRRSLMTEAEAGMMGQEVKECKDCQQPPEARKRQEKILPFIL
jgi:hypothetical protein